MYGYVIYFIYPGLYNKTHRASTVKLEGNSNLVKLSLEIYLLLYSSSHQMTVHVLIEVEKQQIWFGFFV